jgi:G3E family GTPase
MDRDERTIPVTIITGFLGAGKTSVLNGILAADHGMRIAVLVNDFGNINIDSKFLVGVEDNTISMTNGCICCTLRNDLLRTALEIADRPEQPHYLVIEASGVSDPWAVVETFRQPQVRQRFRVDSIVSVVDAEQITGTFVQQREYAELALRQITVADIVVLNKIDLVSRKILTNLCDWVRSIVPNARILETSYGKIPLGMVFEGGDYYHTLERATASQRSHIQACGCHDCDGTCRCGHDDHNDHHHDHTTEFCTWSYETEQPLLLRAVRDTLKTLPPTIFRAKGILALTESPKRRTMLQLVGSRMTLTVGGPWGMMPPHTQVVFIGTPDGIDTADLQRRFATCKAG